MQQRLQTVETELKASNEAKRTVESRLAMIYSLLSRFFGFRQRHILSPITLLRSKRRGDSDSNGGDETDEALTLSLHHSDRRSRSFSPRKGKKSYIMYI